MTELQDLKLLFTGPRPEMKPVHNAGSEAGPGVSEQDVLIPTAGDLSPSQSLLQQRLV